MARRALLPRGKKAKPGGVADPPAIATRGGGIRAPYRCRRTAAARPADGATPPARHLSRSDSLDSHSRRRTAAAGLVGARCRGVIDSVQEKPNPEGYCAVPP